MSERPILSLPEPVLTPQQKARALLAGRLGNGANALLAGGLITREKHTAILRILAPDLQPVIDSIAKQTKAERS